jgi:MFS family permease
MTKDASGDGRLSVLLAVCLAAVILPLSFSGGAVATPAIGRSLGGGPLALDWITNAFMLTFGATQMAAGALADAYGRKRLFTAGVALFAVLSLAISLAGSVVVLDLLRAAQGLAAAATLAGGGASLAQAFDGRARTRAFSLLGTTFGVGLAFGPLLAGAMIDAFGWRAIFVLTAAVAALALAFGAPRMRESRDPDARGLDWAGAAGFTAALSCFTFGVIQASASGWASAPVLGLLAASMVLLGGFVLAEARVRRPMLDLSLFRYPRFVGVQLLPVATCYCYIVLLVLLPLRFIGVEGCSEVGAGLLMLALSLPMLVVPSIAAALTRWASAGAVSAAGLAIAALGLALLARAGVGDPRACVAPMLVIGLGAGLPWGLMDGLAVSVAPKSRAGMATGVFNTTRVAGEGVALAMVAAVLATLCRSSLGRRLPAAPAAALQAAGERAASGNLGQAARLLPAAGRPLLLQSYGEAFQALIFALVAVTLLCALGVFVLLGRADPEPEEAGAPAGSCAQRPSIAPHRQGHRA